MKPTNSFAKRKIEKGNAQLAMKERKSRRSSQRPNAAVNEKVRLKALNDALKQLQDVIPVKLPEGRKLHKKQTLQLAARYIHFLRGCLDGSRDWSDRNRFWCESDEDYSIIDAIDAAAAAGKKKQKEDGEKVKIKAPSVSESKTMTSFVSAQAQQSDPSYYNYEHWMVHQPEPCPSHPLFHSFMNIQLPLFSGVSPIQNSEFICFDSSTCDVTDPMLTHLHLQERSEQTLTQNGAMKQANEELIDRESSVASFSSIAPSNYLQTRNDHLEDIWTDLNEIISRS